MDANQLFLLLSKLVFCGIATFLAIALWARMRDLAWMLIVVGTVLGYADIVLSLLSLMGLIDLVSPSLGGISVVPLVSANLPYIFYSLAFSIMIFKKRLR
jgi:hypothetical protein